MSCTLEYNRIIYKNKEENLVIFTNRLGDSNVWESDNNQRPKEWYLVMIGTEQDYWREIGQRLVDVQGGMLQRAVGWTEYKCFDTLAYIKMYRSKLKNAKPLSELFNDFSIECEYHVKESTPEYDVGFHSFDITASDENEYSGSIYLKNMDELRRWLSHFPHRLYSENNRFTIRISGRRRSLRGRRF